MSVETTEPGRAPVKPLIYVVDDDPLVAEVVDAILQMQHYRTQVFQNPQSALEAFIEADPKPDLLFTDYVMDELNGMELIEKCKRIDPTLRTILYSGSVGQEIYQHHGINADNFLHKPFQPKALLDIIQKTLNS